MNEIICYTTKIPNTEEQFIPFIDILLDDTWANENICYPSDIYDKIGNLNDHLSQKQHYEFLLRAAAIYPFRAIGIASETMPVSEITPSSASDSSIESFKTDCYVTAKYQQELLESGNYQLVVEHLMTCAMALPSPSEGISFMKQMLSYSEEYYSIDDNTQPILVYLPSNFCEDVIRAFSQQLVEGLRQCRQKVETVDFLAHMGCNISDVLSPYFGKRFKAIIGFHNQAFSVKNDSCYLHDLIIGSKYNFLFDHPVALRNAYVLSSPKNYYLLLLDRNYVNFSNRYYKNYISGCFHLPPAGTCCLKAASDTSRIYDVSFVGSYRDYRLYIRELYAKPSFFRHLGARFVWFMKNEPSLSSEAAFQKTLDFYNIRLVDKEFEEWLSQFQSLSMLVSYYYREKIIDTLLKAGITVNIWGDSWHNSPCAAHANCILHSNLPAKDSIRVYEQSKISLNVMTWHKDGFTERIANALLCHSVVLTDSSTYLEENFHSNDDLVLFNLADLKNLPSIVKGLLHDTKHLEQIAHNGYKKAVTHHLGVHRAKQLLDIIEAASSN